MEHDAAITMNDASLAAPEAHADVALDRSFDACRAVVRDRARNFYYGLRISPEPERSAVYALYAWMRMADDCVDEGGPIESRRAALEGFSNDTKSALSGSVPTGNPTWAAISSVMRRSSLDPAVLEDVIHGMRTDLDAAERAEGADGQPDLICTTREDLARYCERVASTVGLCCVRIWGLREGVDPTEADRLAVVRGRAFQLTNILRDFAEDYDEGRVYLPSEDFERQDIRPIDLREWSDPDACAAMVGSIASWAEAQYTESEVLTGMVSERCAPTLVAMSGIYRSLLAKIRKDPSAIASGKRVRLSPVKKVAIALKSVRASRRDDEG